MSLWSWGEMDYNDATYPLSLPGPAPQLTRKTGGAGAALALSAGELDCRDETGTLCLTKHTLSADKDMAICGPWSGLLGKQFSDKINKYFYLGRPVVPLLEQGRHGRPRRLEINKQGDQFALPNGIGG